MSQETALLTGFPAPRAQLLLVELLRDARVRVIALVHKDRAEEAAGVVQALESGGERVELLEGDPAAIDFGLSGRAYLELARSAHFVHATYSLSDAGIADETSEAVNVGAARELVEFSRAAGQLRKLVFYSSVFVSGQRSGRVRESELEAGQSFRNAAERTLAIAERMLARSHAPRVILRAGHLMGDSQTGRVEHLNGPYLLMIWVISAASATLPAPPRADALLPLTPLDYLARLGAFVARSPEAQGTFHAIDPDSPKLRRFLELVAERSNRRLESGFNPSNITRALISNPALRLLPQHTRGIWDVVTSAAEYATESVAALESHGAPVCPPLVSYLDRLLDHVRERIEQGNLFAERRAPAPFLVA